MKRIGLATYSVKIRVKGKDKKTGSCKFDRLPKETTIFNTKDPRFYDAIDVISEILKGQCRFKDNNRKLICDVIEIRDDEERIIYGFLGYGEYGTDRTIGDKNDVEYKEELPKDKVVKNQYYFMFKLPKGQDMGVLFLERRGNYGLKTLLDKGINEKLLQHKLYKKFIIDIEPLIDRRVFEKYIKEGVLKSLNYTRTSIPNSSFKKRKHVNGRLNVNVKFSDRTFLKDIFEHVNIFDNKDKAAKDEFLTFNGETYNNLSFQMDAGNSPRTFNYTSPEKSAPYLDITKELGVKASNHSLESIHNIAKKYEEEMISNIWRTD
jgi:hypothetical protein